MRKLLRTIGVFIALGTTTLAAAPHARALTVTYDVEGMVVGDAPVTLTLDIDDDFVASFAGRSGPAVVGTATVSFAQGQAAISWPDIVIDCIQAPCPEEDAIQGLDLGEFALPDQDVTLALGISLDQAVDTPDELLAALMSVVVVVGSFDTSGPEPVFLNEAYYDATAAGLEAPLPPAAALFLGGAAGLTALRRRVRGGADQRAGA